MTNNLNQTHLLVRFSLFLLVLQVVLIKHISTSKRVDLKFSPPYTNIYLQQNQVPFYLNSTPPVADKSKQHKNNLPTKWSDLVVKTFTNFKLAQPSIFPSIIPPTIHFAPLLLESLQKHAPELSRLTSELKWVRTIPLMNHIVKNMGFTLVERPGFRKSKNVQKPPTKDSNHWVGYFSTKVGSRRREPINVIEKPYQKYNLIPGGEQLCHKDKMWLNLQKLISKFGAGEFPTFFESYAWPSEAYQFVQRISATKKGQNDQSEFTSREWIFKPSRDRLCNGIVIFKSLPDLLKSWELKYHKHGLIQAYLAKENSYTINSRLVRLRAFVLLTSVSPLRIYLYKHYEPLLITDAQMEVIYLPQHQFETLIRKNGSIKLSKLNQQIEESIIQVMISGEAKLVQSLAAAQLPNRYSSYQFWSADFMIHKDGTPLLMELNRYADLSTPSVNNALLRIPLLFETLNVAGYHFPPTLSEGAKSILRNSLPMMRSNFPICFKENFYAFPNSSSRAANNRNGLALKESNAIYRNSQVLDFENSDDTLANLFNLTEYELEELLIAENELSRATNYKRIFPTRTTHKYLKYFESTSRMYDLQNDWENFASSNRSAGIEFLKEILKYTNI